MNPGDRGVFEGVEVGADTTLFHRPGLGGTEGFVVDNARLVETLKQRVLEARGLSEVVEVAPLAGRGYDSAPEVATGHIYQHTFAEPFASLSATLRLAPLEVPWIESMLLPLTVLLGLLLILGLWALYRVVATQLEFSQRQSNFVAAVSHELKTPLTAIRMHSEMLQEGLVENDAKAQEYYKTITSQAERLSRLIGGVLLLSQLEQGTPSQAKKGDLSATMRSVITALEPHIKKSGFALELSIPTKLPPVEFDQDFVEQILFNLLENSLKYAKDAADKRITLSSEVTPTHVVITVRDRGPGVPMNEQSRIFQPFYRLEDELTRRNTGTGLGLALVQNLAEKMNARVTARNENPGLAIVVQLPRSL